MAEVVLLGSGKFALEVARYVRAAGHTIGHFLALDGDEVAVPDGQWTHLSQERPAAGTEVVLAVSDMERRAAVVRDCVEPWKLDAINVVHPSSTLEPDSLRGVGNIIGPDNYLGVNTTFGSFNVLNYRSSVGHHSRVGSLNFIAPNFHTGNTVTIGSGNFFGVGCHLAPEVTVGDNCRVQAGLTLFEDTVDGRSYLAPSRIKSLPIH